MKDIRTRYLIGNEFLYEGMPLYLPPEMFEVTLIAIDVTIKSLPVFIVKRADGTYEKMKRGEFMTASEYSRQNSV